MLSDAIFALAFGLVYMLISYLIFRDLQLVALLLPLMFLAALAPYLVSKLKKWGASGSAGNDTVKDGAGSSNSVVFLDKVRSEASQISSMSKGLADSTDRINRNTGSEGKALAEINEALGQINTSVGDMSGRAVEVYESTSQAVDLVRQGKTEVSNSMEMVQQNINQLESLLQAVQELSKDSQETSRLVGMIENKILILTRTYKEAYKYQQIAVDLLEGKQKLKVKPQNTTLTNVQKALADLGFSKRSKVVSVYPEKVKNFIKDKIKNTEQTIKRLKLVLHGWANYLVANGKRLFAQLMEWLRRKPRKSNEKNKKNG